MDIELSADNFMSFMADENAGGEENAAEAALLQHMADAKKEKDSKKDNR